MNIKQTRIVFVPKENNIIYEIKRAKQVFIYKKNEKHIFTIILLGFCKDKVLSI